MDSRGRGRGSDRGGRRGGRGGRGRGRGRGDGNVNWKTEILKDINHVFKSNTEQIVSTTKIYEIDKIMNTYNYYIIYGGNKNIEDTGRTLEEVKIIKNNNNYRTISVNHIKVGEQYLIEDDSNKIKGSDETYRIYEIKLITVKKNKDRVQDYDVSIDCKYTKKKRKKRGGENNSKQNNSEEDEIIETIENHEINIDSFKEDMIFLNNNTGNFPPKKYKYKDDTHIKNYVTHLNDKEKKKKKK